MRAARPVDVARFGLGVLALARPDVLITLTDAKPDATTHRVVRILGARYLIQSGGGMLHERPWLPAADATVDLIHAATMLGVAALSGPHRRLALISAGAAVVFAGLDLKEKVR